MQLVVVKSNTLTAFSWIKQGWRLFTLQPGPFMAMSAFVLALTLIAQMQPVLSIVFMFAAPFLSAGFYQAASRADSGEALQATDIFALFGQFGRYRVFIRLAGLSILFSIPMSLMATDVIMEMEQGVAPQMSTLLAIMSLMAINFMLFAFAVPAAWVAPETPVMTLVKQSFEACWRNAIPLSLYGVLIAVLVMISLPIILVGWLIMYAVSTLAFYQMFLSVYRPIESDEAGIQDDTENDDVAQD